MVKTDDSRVSSSFSTNRGSSVSLETTLRAGWSRNLGSVSGSVQTSFEAPPASYTVVTVGNFFLGGGVNATGA